MPARHTHRSQFRHVVISVLSASGALAVAVAQPVASRASGSVYAQTNLVSDQAGHAAMLDPQLQNAWGLAYIANGPFWVSDNNSGYSTLYDGNGNKQSMVVSIPPPTTNPMALPGTPTGMVANSSGGAGAFLVTKGMSAGPSLFIFDTEDGTIAGWAPTVDANNAITAVDNSGADGSSVNAVYKGLALAGSELYATDFRNGNVAVFSSTFTPITTFTDPSIPAGFAPFGIASVNNSLIVTFAKQDSPKHDSVAGAGLGYVDVFNLAGTLTQRLVSQGPLNAPWGIATAPSSGFGDFSGKLLIGNFGDGTINVFDPTTGAFLGTMQNTSGNPLSIDGLWGLEFGNGGTAGPTTTLFFSAGPSNQTHGLFGALTPGTPTAATPEAPQVGLMILVGLGALAAARILKPSRRTKPRT